MKPREPRRKVFVKARIRVGGSWGDVCVRDISSRGLLLQASEVPRRGSYIEVRRGRHNIVARVVWAAEQRFGVQAQDPISIEGFVGESDLSSIDFKSASRAQPGFDRRAEPRGSEAQRLEQRLERSRRISAILQFGVLVGMGAAAATAAFDIAGKTLAAPLAILTASLGGPNASPPAR